MLFAFPSQGSIKKITKPKHTRIAMLAGEGNYTPEGGCVCARTRTCVHECVCIALAHPCVRTCVGARARVCVVSRVLG